MDAAINPGNKPIGIIILAAGSSQRMNQPKQLLQFEGKTLLRRAIETAVESVYEPVVVVLGANFEKTKSEITGLPVKLVFNKNWQEGLSSSIKAGIKTLLEITPDITAGVITLADQPFVSAKHLNLFFENFEKSESAIIAAEYNGTIGVPALFSREVFDDLCALSGDKGAKPVIEKYRDSLSKINLPEAAFDIDTPQDFLNLNNRS